MKKCAIAASIAAGCAVAPQQPAQPSPTADTEIKPASSVNVEGTNGGPGSKVTIRVTFTRGFPVQGHNGIINKEDGLSMSRVGWSVDLPDLRERYEGTTYTATYTAPLDRARYNFRLKSDIDVFLNAEDAHRVGLGQGYGSGAPNYPDNQTYFLLELKRSSSYNAERPPHQGAASQTKQYFFNLLPPLRFQPFLCSIKLCFLFARSFSLRNKVCV